MFNVRSLNFEEFNSKIELKRKDVNDELRKKYQYTSRRANKTTRTPGEKQALTEIAISSWENAISQGKIKKLGDRVLYYDYTS